MRLALVTALIIVAAGVGGLGRATVRDGAPDPRLGRVASALAGRSAIVHCWSAAGWRALTHRIHAPDAAGVTNIRARRIDLSPTVCDVLRHIRQIAAQELWIDPAFGLVALAHESQHAAGFTNEAVAECRGLQLVAREAVLFGVPRSFGQDFALEYWLDAYQYLPRRYRTSECRNGGKLDLRPHSNVWP